MAVFVADYAPPLSPGSHATSYHDGFSSAAVTVGAFANAVAFVLVLAATNSIYRTVL
jgi:hypothetical protein